LRLDNDAIHTLAPDRSDQPFGKAIFAKTKLVQWACPGCPWGAICDRPTAPASPWQNGFTERLIGSIRRECLDDHVVIWLRPLLQWRQNASIFEQGCAGFSPVQRTGVISSRAILGGLHHHYAFV
jgi:hypothetical protein